MGQFCLLSLRVTHALVGGPGACAIASDSKWLSASANFGVIMMTVLLTIEIVTVTKITVMST